MTTVYRNRALSDPDNKYMFLFANDKSGSVAYQALENADFRIIRPDRYEAFVEHAVAVVDYDVIRITSLPKIVQRVAHSGAEVVYEFHSSDERVIERELSELNLGQVAKITAPSDFLADVVRSKLPSESKDLVEVLPNLVDAESFALTGSEAPLAFGAEEIPLVWIGRLDKGKNIADFIRVLSLLPATYHGIAILSFEDQPHRMADLLGLAASLGVAPRLRILLNLSQPKIADIYRQARDRGGFFCSTSLGESFGYGVAEALACGLNSIAFNVGALGELTSDIANYDLVPVGDLHAFAESVLRRAKS